MKILVFEDDPTLVTLILDSLGEIQEGIRERFEIKVSQTVEETVSYLDIAQIAIMDITLEEREGLAALAGQKQVMSILMTNALRVPEERFSGPCMEVMQKPYFELKKFERAIRRFVLTQRLFEEMIRQSPLDN